MNAESEEMSKNSSLIILRYCVGIYAAGLGKIMKISLRKADPKTEIRIDFFLNVGLKAKRLNDVKIYLR
jgi:hypothetical protein